MIKYLIVGQASSGHWKTSGCHCATHQRVRQSQSSRHWWEVGRFAVNATQLISQLGVLVHQAAYLGPVKWHIIMRVEESGLIRLYTFEHTFKTTPILAYFKV